MPVLYAQLDEPARMRAATAYAASELQGYMSAQRMRIVNDGNDVIFSHQATGE